MIEVSLALVREGDRWLVTRRAGGRIFAGSWEFAGGKVEPGEPVESAAVREARRRPAWESSPSVMCRVVAGEVHPASEAVGAVAWIRLEELPELDMPPAHAEIIRRIEGLARSAWPYSEERSNKPGP